LLLLDRRELTVRAIFETTDLAQIVQLRSAYQNGIGLLQRDYLRLRRLWLYIPVARKSHSNNFISYGG
jgi:hypothetical protein